MEAEVLARLTYAGTKPRKLGERVADLGIEVLHFFVLNETGFEGTAVPRDPFVAFGQRARVCRGNFFGNFLGGFFGGFRFVRLNVLVGFEFLLRLLKERGLLLLFRRETRFRAGAGVRFRFVAAGAEGERPAQVVPRGLAREPFVYVERVLAFGKHFLREIFHIITPKTTFFNFIIV